MTKKVRHERGGAPLSREVALDAVTQAIRGGLRGHDRATRIYDTRWLRNQRRTPLKPAPLLPYGGRTLRLRVLATVAAQR